MIIYTKTLDMADRNAAVKSLRAVFKGQLASSVVRKNNALFWYPFGFDPYGEKVHLYPALGPSSIFNHLKAISGEPWVLKVATGVDWICYTYASIILPLDAMSGLPGDVANAGAAPHNTH